MGRPTKRQKDHVPASPVTASEVEDLFRAASQRGPWPDKETLDALATVLTRYIGFGLVLPADTSALAEARHAANTLLNFIASMKAPEGDWDYLIDIRMARLETALQDAMPFITRAQSLQSGAKPSWGLMVFGLAEAV